MSKRGISLAIATEEDLDKTRGFLQVLDQLFDSRWFSSHESQWEDWDDEDENKQHLLRVRKQLAWEEDCDEDEIDNKLILFEFIKQKYKECDCHWGRSIMNAQVLIDNV